MLDQKKMDRFKQSGASAALELREEIIAGLKGQISDTMQAINGYFADREKRQKAISDRIEALKNQREALEAEVAAFGPRLAAATISGDVNTLEQIQSRLTDLEAQKAAISAQIELLSGVSVAGDKELFGKADEKARSLDQFWTDTLADLTALSVFANEQAGIWGQVANASTSGGDILPRNAVFSRAEAMRADFREVE